MSQEQNINNVPEKIITNESVQEVVSTEIVSEEDKQAKVEKKIQNKIDDDKKIDLRVEPENGNFEREREQELEREKERERERAVLHARRARRQRDHVPHHRQQLREEHADSRVVQDPRLGEEPLLLRHEHEPSVAQDQRPPDRASYCSVG